MVLSVLYVESHLFQVTWMGAYRTVPIVTLNMRSDTMKEPERFKYISVDCKFITTTGLVYKNTGKKKKTHDSVLYEYELVE